MIQRVSVRFTGPGANQVVADLAAKAGITDLVGLRCALARAHAEMHIFASGGGWARTSDGPIRPVSYETFEAGRRVADLVAELGAELAAAPWPITGCQVADDLRRALSAYADHVETTHWRVRAAARTLAKSATGAFVIVLANEWPKLTGSDATAWRTGGRPNGRGRFYEWLGEACQAFGLRCPSASTVKGLLQNSQD